MYRMRFLTAFLIVILLNGCIDGQSYDADYKKIEYNGSEDIGQLASGFKPDKKYKSWYFLRSSDPINLFGITILYKSENATIVEEDIKELNKGFITRGHHSNRFYYLLVIKNGEQFYLTEKEEVVDFFGKIDTKEEALLLAMIEEFNIDSNNLEGSSYKQTKKGYDFLLMKNDIDSPLSTEYRQYKVSVSKNGEISWKKGEIYCRGYNDCYGTD